ncbi:nuclear pore complex protein Nup98-Nup96-like isoform X3 [Rhodnius prolixus]|uniref:nuclear pore complex protein Nup98-Nup96-like isoform X3 n=1 Tax=Rhodnius prolixus TaxID=13249 RepID=UPI003D18F597
MFQGTGFAAASTSSPFGQTAFGKPATTGFNPPVFGSNTGTSLFGGATTQQSGLFGGSTATPAFGQAQTTQPTFGTGFTSTSAGSTTGLFGGQASTANTGGLFGSNTTSAFGQAKPNAFGAFGTSGVGQTATPTPQPGTSSLFGQPQTQSASGLFGANTGFGAGGTTVKFTPVTGTDTMVKNGTTSSINTRHHCITCMKEYETKSLEELRLEDYAANRKGPRQGTQTGTVFGTTGQMSLFGASTSTAGTTSNLFGSSGENKSLLGSTTNTGFGTSGGTVFGSTSTNLFGKPAGTATAFGAPASTTAGTFGFNTTANANPFGANAAQKPFGTPATTGLFGTPAQQTTGFGTNTSGFGSFGTAQTSLFGEQKPAFGIGTNTGFSLSQPSSTSTTSLFGGQKPTLGSSFGTGGFGQPATTSTAPTGFGTPFGQQQQSGGLLGAASGGLKTTSTGFSFGQPTNTLGGTNLNLGSGGTSIFGQQAQKPGSLFGSTNMGGTGLFGSNNMNTFGTNTMFNTGSSTLGTTGTTGTLGSAGGFGTLGSLGGGMNQANQLGSGAVPAQFVNPIHQHLATFTALPYGDSPIFRNVLKASSGGKADELLKPTSPAAQKALMSGQNYKVTSKPTTKIKIKPIETNNLTKKALFEELDAEDEGISNTGNTEQWPVLSRRRLLIKPTISSYAGDTTISPLISALQKRASLNNSGNCATNLQVNSPTDVIGISSPLKHSTSLFNSSPNQRAASSSTPQSGLKLGKVDRAGTDVDPLSPVASSSLQKKVLFKNVDGEVNKGITAELRSKVAKETSADHSTTSSSDSDQEESIPAELDNSSEGTGHPTGITLRRAGYYTIPTLDELAGLVDDQGRCIVDNFTVGRLNYGNIFYPDSFDVSGLNLDEIVHFRHKEVTVYPNDSVKPPVGEGLNRRAQVTLDRVWPVDKTTRLPITEPTRILAMDYESKLSRACAKHGTNYVEYRPTTGSWVFKVDHFSKYGLTDSDEDDNGGVDIKKIKLGVAAQTGTAIINGAVPPLLQQQQQSVPQLQIPSKQVEDALTALMAEEDEDMDDGITNPFDLDEELERRTLSPTAKLAKQTGTNARKLQMMKASFFDKNSFNLDGECLDLEDIVGRDDDGIGEDGMNEMRMNSFKRLTDTLSWYHRQGAADLLNMSHLAEVADRRISKDDLMRLERISDQEVQPLHVIPAEEDSVLKQSSDLENKIFPYIRPKIYELHYLGSGEVSKPRDITQPDPYLSTKYIVDLGYFKRFSFKVGVGPQNQFITLASANKKMKDSITLQNPLTSPDFASLKVFCPVAVATGSPVGQYKARFQESVNLHLEAALTESIIEQTKNGPKIIPRPGTASLEAHYLISGAVGKNFEDPHFILANRVFGLMHALWAQHEGCDASGDDHSCLMIRKNAVSEWLESTLSDGVLQKAESSKGPSAIFTYMTGLKLADACETAQDIHDLQLSLLISQAGGSRTVRELVQHQLIQWRETEADRHINIDRLKCYLLIAGLPIHQASNGFINTCEHQDWLTSFAIHFWFVTSASSTVTDALIAYDEAYKGDNGYAVLPLPGYNKDYEIQLTKFVGNKEVVGHCYDIFYHLLHLFSEKSYPLEQILNPATHTPDLLDYRIVWLVTRLLSTIGYSHLSEHSAAIIHSSFADQLETYGLWEWAVFVLLHLTNDVRREATVRQVIDRFVTVEEECPKELFLIQRLSIPESWIYEAKATKAKYLKRYEDAAKYLIKASKWDECHKLVIEHIASKAIVNERYGYLEDLFSQLTEKSHLITGWSGGGGGTLLDYLRVVRKVDELVAARDHNALAYHLEEMQPQLTNLCRSIKLVPSKTPLDRLAQCEMSKRTADLLQNLIIGSTTEQENDEDDAMAFSGCVDALASLIAELPLPSDYRLDQWLGVGNLWKRCASAPHK